ncbi:MAG: transporter substrate-binding domain-containing protein [Proteobacteria bacterium]|nr:transporter substrate-binding domain-containing protein [Pseudomonadota bacterium]
MDAFLGASITEERKKAVDMFGPLYGLAHVMLNREGFNPGNNWADYNKSEIKIASVTGTTDEAAARKFAPKATIISLRQDSEAILSVQSGHANALVS